MENNAGLQDLIKQFHDDANIACEQMKQDFATITYNDMIGFLLTGKIVRVVENIFLYEVPYFESQGLNEFEVVAFSRWNRLPEPSLN